MKRMTYAFLLLIVSGTASANQPVDVLIEAARSGDVEKAKYALEKGAGVNERNKHGATGLYTAAGQGKADILRLLLERKADVDFRFPEYKLTPLMAAASAGHSEAVQVLVGHKADMELGDVNDETALMKAAARGHVEVVKILLAKGAKLSPVQKDGETALSIAIAKGLADVTAALLEKEPEPGKWRDPQHGWGLMAVAAKGGEPKIIKMLLDRGVEVDQLTNWRGTPLIIAAMNNRTAAAGALLDAGANVHHLDKYGTNAVWRAAEHNNPELMKLLVERGGRFLVAGL